jgi:DNA-binding MarR family transcriptional regulator/GNAT superfamily N-acetyltransferase
MHARPPKADAEFNNRIAAMRRFNRFYTREIGVLRKGYLGSPFSLAEARVLYEIGHRGPRTASDVARALDLDAGYLSRLLRNFETRGLIARKPSEKDARQAHLALTARGKKAYAPLERDSQEFVGAMLRKLSAPDQARLVAAMATIEQLIGPPQASDQPYVLRSFRPGDMGWVVARHGLVYGEEYGWDETIEALTAEIVAAFVRNYDPKREQCWIAERDGENVGCVFLVKEDETTARLRLLLVDPKARGLGIGARLVDECVRFGRQAGYRRITLWTHRVLDGARKIYIGAGFELTREWTHDDFGKTLVAETWDLEL